jgi:hypothetical protein
MRFAQAAGDFNLDTRLGFSVTEKIKIFPDKSSYRSSAAAAADLELSPLAFPLNTVGLPISLGSPEWSFRFVNLRFDL